MVSGEECCTEATSLLFTLCRFQSRDKSLPHSTSLRVPKFCFSLCLCVFCLLPEFWHPALKPSTPPLSDMSPPKRRVRCRFYCLLFSTVPGLELGPTGDMPRGFGSSQKGPELWRWRKAGPSSSSWWNSSPLCSSPLCTTPCTRLHSNYFSYLWMHLCNQSCSCMDLQFWLRVVGTEGMNAAQREGPGAVWIEEWIFSLVNELIRSLSGFHHLVLWFLKETLESLSSCWIEKYLEEGRQMCFYSKIKWFI